MKVFCFEMGGPVERAMRQVLSLLTESEFVGTLEEADLAITMNIRDIEGKWNMFPEKMFVVMVLKEKSESLPANVHEVFISSAVLEIIQIMENTESPLPLKIEKLKRPPAPADAPRVLVIDDTPANIRSAEETVPFEYGLVTATGYDEAMDLLSKEKFDIVLTDLHMPMSSRCLGPKAFRLGELVPYGLLIVMESLARRVEEIAVVTDLGHHDDPFSAAFDHFTREAIRAGKTHIRLLHAPLRADGSKDWGKVLAD